MGLSKSGCSSSITKEDLEHKYKTGFADGLKAACSLILEPLKDQRFEILDDKTAGYETALKTIDDSIHSVEKRLEKYSKKDWRNTAGK